MPLENEEQDDTPDRQVAEGFEGFDNKTDPRLLPPGMLTDGLNMWCRGDGYVETRPGFKLVARCAFFAVPGSTHPEVRGMAYFDTPAYEALLVFSSDQMEIVLGVDTVYGVGNLATYGGTAFEQVPMVQMIDRMFFLRQGILHTAIRSGGGVWTVTTITLFSTGAAMPLWSKLATQGFRLFLLEENGYQLYGSAVGNAAVAANWVPTENIRVGSGDGDPGRALIAGQAGFITLLNARSAWQIDTSAATVAAWTSRRVTGLVGCVEGRTAVTIGQDVLFLSRYGVVSLGALADSLSISPQNLISWPIQPYIDRINWASISYAFATTWNDCYILAVPLDSETYPKHLLVYNLRTRRWMAPWKYNLPTATHDDATTTAWSGFTAACTTNFADKAETILADNTGRLYRLDLTATTDEAVQGAETAISYSYAVARTTEHGAPSGKKSGLAAEVVTLDSSGAATVNLYLLRDGAPTVGEGGVTSGLQDALGGGSFTPATLLARKRMTTRGNARYREAALEIRSSAGGRLKVRSMALEAFVDSPEIAL